ncbi:hypothetical protein [Streptomyces cupreus]|uniref:Uncharacterized protein n=1 Tax=Streptomyces cupreus TaxID=2759956 RepID=A0A7X1M7C1_9ACTN|nr:hypothetical protein [Streptomyces cupreus]MBC2900787.1 hypothetical protein [Streptomyces cupreus]
MDRIACGTHDRQITAPCSAAEKATKNHLDRIFAKSHSVNRAEASAKCPGRRRGSRQGLR